MVVVGAGGAGGMRSEQPPASSSGTAQRIVNLCRVIVCAPF
jgi:hypothetical protein